MATFYNCEEIKNSLRKDIAVNREKIRLWKSVEFHTKKDGAPFKNMQKNISGANWGIPDYGSVGEYRLTVSGFSNGYFSDIIYCYFNIGNYATDEQKALAAKKPENLIESGLGYKRYIADIEDVKALIAERIAYLESRTSDMEYQLSIADKLYSDFESAYIEAQRKLYTDSKVKSFNEIYGMIVATVTERHKYDKF